MDRFHSGRAGRWWVVVVCVVGACGGRSGELYDDPFSQTTGGAGGSATGGSGGSATGGSGGSATGGTGGFATGGSGGFATGGTGGFATGGSGGGDTGGTGGGDTGGSGGGDTGGATSIGGTTSVGGVSSVGGSDTGGTGGNDTGGTGGAANTSSTTGLIGGIGGFGTTVTTTGGPLDCLGCIGQECPFIAECVQEAVCFERLDCTVDVCLRGGDITPDCILKCHEGDAAAAFELGAALACAAESCGNRCEFE